ncbi:MAG: MBL fold metallo-hydrolase [Smithellaceae bacterium]|nr:MBL fold metallo-hydrolase [Smithellaceae bacterium]
MKKHYKSLLMDKNGLGQEGVRLTWLGTAGIFITDGKTGILIDPYVSRFSLSTIAFRLPLKPDRALIRNWAEKLGREKITAVIVSHSHFDHAADAPFFAIEAGAPLVGTESTVNVGRGAGLEESKLIAVKPGQTITFGDFTIEFIESVHGAAVLGRVPFPGTIDQPLVPPAAAGKYRLGGVFALLIEHPAGTILHHGSAGFKPGMYDGISVDVVLLGISGRGNTDRYLENVALKTRAKLVVPIHVDNFLKPLKDGMSFLPMVKFGEFCRKAQQHREAFIMRTAPLCKEVTMLPLDATILPGVDVQ